MTRRVEYRTLDIGKPKLENNYVYRYFTIDTPDSDILFKIIDVLEEWYQDLKLRKIERIDKVDCSKYSFNELFDNIECKADI